MKALLLAAVGAANAAPHLEVTANDYARAARFLSWNADRYVVNGQIRYRWIGNEDRLWYVRVSAAGKKEVIVVNARSGERTQLNGQDRAMAGLAPRVGEASPAPVPAAGEVMSPDGKWAVFMRGYDLWARAAGGGESFPLTTDGTRERAYAISPGHPVDDARRAKPIRPLVSWSPDSHYVLTHRLDQSGVKEVVLTQSVPEDHSTRPTVYSYRYAMPGDERVTEVQPVLFDLAARRQVNLQARPLVWMGLTPIEHQNTWWSTDSKSFYYLERDRFSKWVALKKVDARSGTVTEVMRETSATLVKVTSGSILDPPVVRTLGNGDVIWYSPRDGWGHLYYHDGKTGALKHRITRGQWVVRAIVRVDEPAQTIFFTASGREKGRDPYELYLYRVRFDGSGLRLLTPEPGHHEAPPRAIEPDIAPGGAQPHAPFSDSGQYFVDSYSSPDRPPVFVLRAADGRLVTRLEETDISALQASGFTPVEPFRVKAADGVTDIFGNLFRPSTFDPAKKYPVIDAVYPGPSGRVRKSFNAAVFDSFEAQSLAELGFIVVTIDGRGTAHRSQAFFEHAYGHVERASDLEDHIAGMRQLAQKYPYMDLTRVGVDGASAGGYAAAHAILRYPEFFAAAVAAEGTHDLRAYHAAYSEAYNGLLTEADYERMSNLPIAPQLRGKLLLMHGELDDNVLPSLTLKLADALIRSNRDFDLLIIPNGDHLAFTSPYFIRRKWDYFVRHLLGAEPPASYSIRPAG